MLDLRPRHRRALRHLLAAARQHALRRLRPAAGLHHVHRAQPIPRGHGSRAAILAESRGAAQYLRHVVQRRSRSRSARWPTTHSTTAPLTVNHQGQFSAVTISFNLAAGHGAGRRGQRHQRRPSRRSACRKRSAAAFTGTAQAFQASLANEPILIVDGAPGRLHRPRHPLRELHPSHHHPLHAAARRAWARCWR